MKGIAAELIDDAPCGILVTDPEGRIEYLNATLGRWLGRKVPTDGSGRLGDLLTVPGRIFYDTHMAPMLTLQGFVREISCDLALGDGGTLPVLLSGVMRRDDAGRPSRFDFTIFDARERKIYEQELRKAQREADELAAIVRNSPNAIIRTGPDGRIERQNDIARVLFDDPGGDVTGRPVAEVVRLEGMDDWFADLVARAAETGCTAAEVRHVSGADLEISLAQIDESRDWRRGCDWSIVLQDISARKQSERHLRIVVEETRHRLKNTISVISSIARQTLDPEARQVFLSRLQALSRAHDSLTRSDWTRARLHEVLEFTSSEAGGPECFAFDVPDVWLAPQQTTSLSMALHELTTNALKYGGLSRPGGRVEVTADWQDHDEGRVLTLVWQETGGPKVRAPGRKGFGTVILSQVLSAELPGRVTFDFRPEGLRFESTFIPEGRFEPA